MKGNKTTKVPTDAEYKAIVERHLNEWVDLFIKDEFKAVARNVHRRQYGPLVRHFLSERTQLMAAGHSVQAAHKIATEQLDLLRRRPDFERFAQLVGAGISIPTATELMEEVRAFDARIEEAESEVEAAGDHIESLQEEVELLQDELEDLEQQVETLQEDQVVVWIQLCEKYGVRVDWEAEMIWESKLCPEQRCGRGFAMSATDAVDGDHPPDVQTLAQRQSH